MRAVIIITIAVVIIAIMAFVFWPLSAGEGTAFDITLGGGEDFSLGSVDAREGKADSDLPLGLTKVRVEVWTAKKVGDFYRVDEKLAEDTFRTKAPSKWVNNHIASIVVEGLTWTTETGGTMLVLILGYQVFIDDDPQGGRAFKLTRSNEVTMLN